MRRSDSTRNTLLECAAKINRVDIIEALVYSGRNGEKRGGGGRRKRGRGNRERMRK